MQHVTAFSRPQTVPAVPAEAPKKTLWILNSWRDLILYVGTPLLLLPIFALAQVRWRAQDIYLFVAAFGAMGHHLPGMIRAYGDRALFERFRWRFIIAPIFLLAVCVAFSSWDLKGVVLVVFVWGVWHGMMQTYGFCRIYDAKMGSFAPLTRRLDFAACAVWFAAGVLLSPQRMTDTLETYYACGGPFVAPWLLRGAQTIVTTAAVLVTLLFLFNFSRMWAEGRRPNPVKLVLLITSIGFWWYCNNGVTNILAGIALFEVFHDVQYLSLVWIYNRNRVDKDKSITGFMRFMFRRSGSLIGLYIGLVFAYGSLGYINSHLEIETVKRVLTGIVAASGLLHFYYDGFIWKVRERSTRESLGLAGGLSSTSAAKLLPSWLGHGLKWGVAFVIPLGALWIGQTRSTTLELDRAAWIVADLPNSNRAHWKYGTALQDAHQLELAAQQYRLALRSYPKERELHVALAEVLVAQSKFDEGQTELRWVLTDIKNALHGQPNNGELHSKRGHVLDLLGEREEAATEFEKAVTLSPQSARIHYDYAMFLFYAGKIDSAATEFQTALRYKPDHSEAHYHLGRVLFLKGHLEGAKTHYLETARLDPKAPVHNSLGVVCMRLGQTSEAIVEFKKALRLRPDDTTAAENLRVAIATEERNQRDRVSSQ